uniref:5-formyltetrahydrofolate cyclo-ligase n=1 Tax=Panagrolaimus sp. ES5 TaxID=591445 RepID=A0AC34F787_9BILA
MLKLQNLKEYQTLGPSVWGIKQHSRKSSAEDYFLTGPLDLILVPAYAFTINGRRLGKGMGYYDKFFESHQKQFGLLPKLVGLAFKQQILEDLPIEKHDISMDLVVTP